MTVNDESENSTIKHYDDLGKLVVEQCAMHSYYENGTVSYAKITKGHVVVNGSVEMAYTTSTSSSEVILEGNVEHAHAADEAAATNLNNNDASDSVTWDYDGEAGTKHEANTDEGTYDPEVAGETIVEKNQFTLEETYTLGDGETLEITNANFHEFTSSNPEVAYILNGTLYANSASDEPVTITCVENTSIYCDVTVNMFHGGEGTEEKPYQLATANQWNNFYQAVYDWDNEEVPYFELTNDIDLTNKEIKNYAKASNGTAVYGYYMWFDLDGNDHELKGITYLTGYGQLFPYLWYSNVHDITINYNIDDTRTIAMSYEGVGDLYFSDITTTGSICTTANWATAYLAYNYVNTNDSDYKAKGCNVYYTKCINKASITGSFGSNGYIAVFGSHNGGGGTVTFDQCENYGNLMGYNVGFVGMGNDSVYTFVNSNAVKNYGKMFATGFGGYFNYSSNAETKTINNVTCVVKQGSSSIETATTHSNPLPSNYGDEIQISEVEGASKYVIEYSFSIQCYNYGSSGVWSGGFPRSISLSFSKDDVVNGIINTGLYKSYVCEVKQSSYNGYGSTTPSYNGIYAPESYSSAEILTSDSDVYFCKDGDKIYCLYNDPDYPMWYALLTTDAQNNPDTKGMTVTVSITAYDAANGVLSKAISSYSYTATEARNYLGGNN